MTPLTIIGEHPLQGNEKGELKSRIGTVFPDHHMLITLPGIHAWQRVEFIDYLNHQRQAQGLPELTPAEEEQEYARSVDLILESDLILIRPDPANMNLAFAADDVLQELVPKQHIRFLNVREEPVKQAIKERGDYWRISSLPQTPEEMAEMIERSRVSIGTRLVYYYNRITGTRYLTWPQLAGLVDLDARLLAAHLQEIKDYSTKRNRSGNPEVDFFAATSGFGSGDFQGLDFLSADPVQIREFFQQVCQRFQQAVPPELHSDDPKETNWRSRMYASLVARKDETLTEDVLAGLSLEFYLQIKWLPGGHFEEGEFIFDPVFSALAREPQNVELQNLCDLKARRFIFNFIREFGDLQYVNVGRLENTLSLRKQMPGRRDVYVAEFKLKNQVQPMVRIIRLQKWGISEHLDEGMDLLTSILLSEEYTEYILNRRLGCRQLGMTLPDRISSHKLIETYQGARQDMIGCRIWATYFEREYVSGVASDKLPSARLRSPAYALRLAALLGRAAAINLIVGRTTHTGEVIFDDGDEIILENAQGLPENIIVADHTGTFADSESPLTRFAEAYARPVNQRAAILSDPAAFGRAYLGSLQTRFQQIQNEYRVRKHAFDTLFQDDDQQDPGSFADRWRKVLKRLVATEARVLTESIQAYLQVP